MRSEHITHDELASMIEALPDKLYCPEDIIAIIYAVMRAYDCEEDAPLIFYKTMKMVESVRKSQMN